MSEHIFLSTLAPEVRVEKIAQLSEWRKRELIKRQFPGTAVGGLPWDEALRVAGADFEVAEGPLSVGVDECGTKVPVTTHKGLYRTDNADPVGIVGATYGAVQNRQFLAGLKDLCDRNVATLESIDVQDGGSRISATALIGFSEINARLKSDSQKPETFAHYIRARSAHDGSSSVEFSRYTQQLICLNGATTQTREQRETVRHTRNAARYVERAHDALTRFLFEAREEANLFNKLAQDALALDEFVVFANKLLTDFRGEADTDRKRARREKDVLELTEYFCEGDGNVGASKFDALSAVTDWLTPRREQYKDSAKFARKFKSNDIGLAAQTRQRAVRLLAA